MAANNIFLQTAYDLGIDVLLVQDSWTLKHEENWLIKSHPGFDKFSPNIGTTDTPRSWFIIFTKKERESRYKSKYCLCPEIAVVMVDDVTFVYIYRTPGVALPPLLSCSPAGPTVIGRKLNSVYPE